MVRIFQGIIPEPPSILDISERYEETSRGMDTGVGVHRLVRAGFLDLLSTIRPTR